jgi:HEAT repeat protein
MKASLILAALSCCAATTLVAKRAEAQSLAERVAAAPGDVRMTYAAREGVCGSGNGWIEHRDDRDWRADCESGPIRLTLGKDGRRIVTLRMRIGGSWQARDDVTDLGEVAAAEASDFLLDLAATAAPSVAEDAIMPAAVADVPDPWRRLLALARNRSLESDVREQATFWLGQSATREATESLAEIVDEGDSVEVQKAAVFALSQRDEPERIDTLIGVARTHANREVVRAAFFWLAESEDPRAVDFFEDVLSN